MRLVHYLDRFQQEQLVVGLVIGIVLDIFPIIRPPMALVGGGLNSEKAFTMKIAFWYYNKWS